MNISHTTPRLNITELVDHMKKKGAFANIARCFFENRELDALNHLKNLSQLELVEYTLTIAGNTEHERELLNLLSTQKD